MLTIFRVSCLYFAFSLVLTFIMQMSIIVVYADEAGRYSCKLTMETKKGIILLRNAACARKVVLLETLQDKCHLRILNGCMTVPKSILKDPLALPDVTEDFNIDDSAEVIYDENAHLEWK